MKGVCRRCSGLSENWLGPVAMARGSSDYLKYSSCRASLQVCGQWEEEAWTDNQAMNGIVNRNRNAIRPAHSGSSEMS